MSYRRLPLLGAIAIWMIAVSTALSAPTITRINVRGLQSGATTTIVIDGADLLPSPRLVCSAPITSQILKPGATATKIEFDVTVDAKADPGFYNLALVTDKGTSPLQIFAIDSLPQRPIGKEIEQIPVALHGNFTGSKDVLATFAGKSGQPITIEVEAQRMGGKEQPVIRLLDSAGREIAMAAPSSRLHGDSRLTATLPADGIYTVCVRDLQYAGAGPFRLKIGSWQYADIAFPPAIERGKTASVELIGAAGVEQRVNCTPGALASMPAPWPDAARASGMRPVVSISDITEIVAQNKSEAPLAIGKIKPPFAISGRLSKPGEQGRFSLAVEPEVPLNFSVIAAQIGSPIDAVLEIRNAKGDLLASNDDVPGSSDPQLDFKPAKDVTSIIVVVKDANGGGSEGSVYRLVVMPGTDKPAVAGAAKMSMHVMSPGAKPDFDLLVEDNAFAPPMGGMQLMKVIARRRGYDGPIALRLMGAAPNVELQRAEIPAGADAALVMVTAKPGLDQTMPAMTRIVGEGTSGTQTISRVGTFDQHPLAEMQPWLGNDLLVMPARDAEAAFSADLGATADMKGILGQKVTLPVQCVRPVGFDGPVRLTLMTSQIVPLIANQRTPDPARTLRPEVAAVQIPADAKAQAAHDAKVAAEKALADAETAVKARQAPQAALDAKVKQAADANAKAQDLPDVKAIAAKALADARNAAKTANAATAAFGAKVKEASDALAKAEGSPDAKAAAAKVYADAVKAEKTASAAVAALDAKVTQAAAALAKAQAAPDVKAIAAKALADATSAAKAASTATAALEAKVKQAAEALAKAKPAAEKASEQAKNSMDVTLLIPADLAPRVYDLAFKAELLGRDQRVVATSYTPVRRMNVITPILVKLASSPRIDVRLDAKTGAIARWSGKIERLEGEKGEVTIAFDGLPKGLVDQKVVIPADKTEFKVEFKIPPTGEVGLLSPFNLFATIKAGPAAAIVRSANVELVLNVLPVKGPAQFRSRIRL